MMSSVAPKAYSYLRMSTMEQLRGDSLRRQLQKSREYAAREGLDLVADDELKDIGRSAFKGEHIEGGVLGVFLKRVEQGEIPKGSFLLVENLDRLSRAQPLIAVDLLQRICGQEITVVTLIDGQKYTDLNNNQMQLILSVLTFQRAHEESRTKQKRLQESWTAKRAKASEQPLTSNAPKWLKPILGKDKKIVRFELHRERVEVVNRIFRESVGGIGAWSIARRLNKASTPTFGRSKGWQASYIKKILSSRTVLGEFQPHHFNDKKREPFGDPIPNYYPAIISEEVFAAANAAIKARQPDKGGGGRTGENYANLFKGLLFCARCGAAIRLLNKGKLPKGGRYLVCDAGHRGMACSKKEWRYESFERAFFHHADFHLGIHDAQAANERMLPTLDGKIEVAIGKLDGLKRQAERMDESFAYMVDGPTRSTYERRAKLDGEISSAESALEKLVRERNAKALLQSQQASTTNFEEMYADTGDEDVAGKRALVAQQIRLFVERIDVSTDGMTCFFAEKWRRRFYGSTQEARDSGLFDRRDALFSAPAFASQFRQIGTGKIVQPHPSRPEFYRFICHLRPANQPKDVSNGLAGYMWDYGDGATFVPNGDAQFIYWQPDEY